MEKSLKYIDLNMVLRLISDKPEFQCRRKIDVKNNNDFFVVFYDYVDSHTFKINNKIDNILLECRGIKFDLEGNLLSLPYRKFFNYGEQPELEQTFLYEDHVVLDKLDGSMITFIKDIPYTKNGVSEVADNCLVWLLANPPVYFSIFDMINENLDYTFIFEWLDKNVPIVVKYKESDIVLTGIRSNLSGELLSYDHMKKIADFHKVKVVKCISNKFDNRLYNKIKNSQEDIEGIIVRFESGNMLKLKSDKYLTFHRAKSLLDNRLDLVKIILNNQLDDYLSLSNDKDYLIKINDHLNRVITDFALYAENYLKETDQLSQKDFALQVKELNCSDFLFMCRREKVNLREKIVNNLLKKLTCNKRLNELEYLLQLNNLLKEESNV